MTEAEIRKYHRWIGIFLSLFIIIQVGSGVIIALSSVVESDANAHEKAKPMVQSSEKLSVQKPHSMDETNIHEGSLMDFIHHDGGDILQIIRILTGLGIIGMVFSGTIIFIKLGKRKKNLSNKAL